MVPDDDLERALGIDHVRVFLANPEKGMRLINRGLSFEQTHDMLLSDIVPAGPGTVGQEQLCKNFLDLLDRMLSDYESDYNEVGLVKMAQQNVQRLKRENELKKEE